MRKDLLYTLKPHELTKEHLTRALNSHPEVQFISLAAVDLIGHETDTKIPVRLFLEDLDTYLYGFAAQTDGSSVFLPKIATLNNAKVDMKADPTVNWFVEYNETLMDIETGKPVGTLKIPCFLYHDGVAVDSRHILQEAETVMKKDILDAFQSSSLLQKEFGFTAKDIEEVCLTTATELEFWVKSPNASGDIEALSTSQELKEQYWSKTRGAVRSALEETLILMDRYGIEPEMGHKEVGGVRAKLNDHGRFEGVLEQLEIDWKFSSPKQTADYELFVKNLVREVFIRYGLEVTFLAKPLDKIAGSGEHTHFSAAVKLKDGKRINLFHSTREDFLSSIGYGAIMGVLKNYEVINPFVTSSNEAFKRLKKGYEAPISIVCSLGYEPAVPSRNRTILIGLIRDEKNPLATRFELRAPNPHTNTYLCMASMFMAMKDGISYAVLKEPEELLKELSKTPEEAFDYLGKGRAYRTEKDVFDDFTDEERERYFGVAPETVYENIKGFYQYPEKTQILKAGNVFSEKIIDSYIDGLLYKWYTEIDHRIIPTFIQEIRSFKKFHKDGVFLDDRANWDKVERLKIALMKNTDKGKGVFNFMRQAVEQKEWDTLSESQKLMYDKMDELRRAYKEYKENLLDLQ